MIIQNYEMHYLKEHLRLKDQACALPDMISYTTDTIVRVHASLCGVCVKTKGATHRSVIFFLQKGVVTLLLALLYGLSFILFEDGRRPLYLLYLFATQ